MPVQLDGPEDGPSQPQIPIRAKLFLCTSYALAAWAWRSWEFIVALVLIELYPNSLLMVSAYGLLDNFARVLLGPAVGSYVDRCEGMDRTGLLRQLLFIAIKPGHLPRRAPSHYPLPPSNPRVPTSCGLSLTFNTTPHLDTHVPICTFAGAGTDSRFPSLLHCTCAPPSFAAWLQARAPARRFGHAAAAEPLYRQQRSRGTDAAVARVSVSGWQGVPSSLRLRLKNPAA